MKKILLSIAIVFSGISLIAQSTATDFTANDCSGINHNLFAELDAGKVVVIAWVMPCGSCIGPSLSAYNEVQNYAASDPGRVVFYVADDYANTSCPTLTSWVNTNGMSGVPVFSSSAVNMSGYGAAGMPKIVVLAGPAHSILFNENNGLNVANFNNAIDQGLVAGISENTQADLRLSLFPNPSTSDKATLSFTLAQAEEVSVEIYNALGSKIRNMNFEKQPAGKHESVLQLDQMANGIYFIKLKAGASSQTIRFTVSR